MFQGFRPEYAALPSGSYFAGHWSWTFSYAKTFAKTCLCEAPFYFWCFRRERFERALSWLLFANFSTHPIVFFVIPLLFSTYLHAAIAAEAYAAGAEMLLVGIVLARPRGRREGAIAALVILAANLFSWEFGMYI